VIFPYSVGKYVAQRYHSAKCLNSSCTPNGSGVVCRPIAGQNLFGCDTHGTMVLNEINGQRPDDPVPARQHHEEPRYQSRLYRDVPADHFRGGGFRPGHHPAYLKPYFGPSGWTCTNATAKKDLQHYGFLVLPATLCGNAH